MHFRSRNRLKIAHFFRGAAPPRPPLGWLASLAIFSTWLEYAPSQLDDLWYATINFDILAKQGRKGLERFNKRTKTIQRDDANKKAAMDLAAAVALYW